MTIEDAEKIDVIAINEEGTRLSLVISDHLEWGPDRTTAHLAMLQDKINLYYAYLQSDEFVSHYPNADEMVLAIEVVFLHQPDEAAIKFLDYVGNELPTNGYEFVYRVN